jgi:hypothetical protein
MTQDELLDAAIDEAIAVCDAIYPQLVSLDEGWVTINGSPVFIGDGGEGEPLSKKEIAQLLHRGGSTGFAGEDENMKESLRVTKHASLLQPMYRKGKKLVAKMFARQEEHVISGLKPSIQWLIDSLKESDADEIDSLKESEADDRRTRAKSIIPDNYAPLTMGISVALGDNWDSLLTDAIGKASSQLAWEYLSAEEVPATFTSEYLQDHSLEKLKSVTIPETVSQLRNAIADAYVEDATYADIVEAIQETYSRFSTSRADMIAQTELNDAYNAGRYELANIIGMGEKAWITESGDPCEDCLDNEAEGFIPMMQAFSSGDRMPTAHPKCYCSLKFRSLDFRTGEE